MLVSDNGMDGYAVCCRVDDTTGVPMCRDFIGRSYNIYPMDTSQSTVIASSSRGFHTTTAINSISFRIPAAVIGVKTEAQRTLFIYSEWNLDSDSPVPHSLNNRQAYSVDFATGSISVLQREYRYFNYSLIILFVTFGLAFLVAYFARVRGFVPSPGLSNGYALFAMLLFLSVLGIFVGLNYLDFKRAQVTVPIGRAFGEGAAFCFWFALFPVPRTSGILKSNLVCHTGPCHESVMEHPRR